MFGGSVLSSASVISTSVLTTRSARACGGLQRISYAREHSSFADLRCPLCGCFFEETAVTHPQGQVHGKPRAVVHCRGHPHLPPQRGRVGFGHPVQKKGCSISSYREETTVQQHAGATKQHWPGQGAAEAACQSSTPSWTLRYMRRVKTGIYIHGGVNDFILRAYSMSMTPAC